MTIWGRLGICCAGAVASLTPVVCDASAPLDLTPPTSSVLSAGPSEESLTVSWIAREGAIRGYSLRVACAPDRIVCPEQEWFVARQGEGSLSSYVVRLRVPAGASIVRVGLDAIDADGRHLPVAERFVPRAPVRVGEGSRPADDTTREMPAPRVGSESSVDARPFGLATLELHDRALPSRDDPTRSRTAILLSSRGPPAATRPNS